MSDLPTCSRCGKHPVARHADGRPGKICSGCVLTALYACDHDSDWRFCGECKREELERIDNLSPEEVHQELLDIGYTEDDIEALHAKVKAAIKAADFSRPPKGVN